MRLALLAVLLAGVGTPHTISGLTAQQAGHVARTFIPLPEHVTVLQRPCSWSPGTSCANRDGTIHLHPAHAPYRFPLLHELGHQFAWQYMSGLDLAEYVALARPVDVAQDFASAYANCAISSNRPPRRRRVKRGGVLVFRVPAVVHHAVCRGVVKWWLF